MTNEKFKSIANAMFAEAMKMVDTKGAEYSRSGDALANFRRGSSMLGIEPESAAMLYGSKHWDSIMLFIKTLQESHDWERAEKSLTEPIRGRIIDLINYLLFVGALLEDRQETHTQMKAMLTGTPVTKK